MDRSELAGLAGLAGLAADLILIVHFAFVVFVVLGLGLILLGGWQRWEWVRSRRFRWAHLVAMGIVAIQAWLGVSCPLTVLENRLRLAAGQTAYGESFIAHWLGSVLYHDLPPWVFILAYSVFLALVGIAWWWVRPVARTQQDRQVD